MLRVHGGPTTRDRRVRPAPDGADWRPGGGAYESRRRPGPGNLQLPPTTASATTASTPPEGHPPLPPTASQHPRRSRPLPPQGPPPHRWRRGSQPAPRARFFLCPPEVRIL